MKMRLVLGGLLLAMLTAVLAMQPLLAGQEAQEPKIILHAPLDGSFDAKIAAGTKTASPGEEEVNCALPYGKEKKKRTMKWTSTAPTFEKGVKGQGVLVDEPDTLAYTANDGNINKDRGTIMMWVRPKFSSEDGLAYKYFFHMTKVRKRKAGRLYVELAVFYWKGNTFRVQFCSDDTEKNVYCPKPFKKDEWLHLAFVWDMDDAMALYVNGETRRPGAKCSMEGVKRLTELPEKMFIGTGRYRVFHADAVIDEVVIYDRALSPSAIKAHWDRANAARRE